MTDFTISSFNVKNLIGAEKEYYKFEQYTSEEYAWKEDWLADQLMSLDADIVGFQEIFEEDALRAVIEETNRRAEILNEAAVPDRTAPYRKKAIFRKLTTQAYRDMHLAFAPNVNDGGPGERRPGLAILSRFPFVGAPRYVQMLETPMDIPFRDLTGEDAGSYRLTRISRPIQVVRIDVAGTVVSVINCHLKSKLGEYPRDGREADLTQYDPAGRAMGALKAGLRRMAEAWVMRRLILDELDQGFPVFALGDFNDSEHAVSSEIIAGEVPFKNYSWMRRHDAQRANERYTDEENEEITAAVNAVRLYSAEKLFVRKSLRDMVYTSAFGGVFESIDQIFLSRHFHPDNPERLGEMTYFSVLNDHLTDGSHAEAPYNKLASDHGQIMAHITLGR